jgi:hypothetical protein
VTTSIVAHLHIGFVTRGREKVDVIPSGTEFQKLFLIGIGPDSIIPDIID